MANGQTTTEAVRPRGLRQVAAFLGVALLVAVGFAATPTEARADDGNLAALQARIEQLVIAYPVPGEYAVAVTDLQTGQTIGVNADRWQLAGCSINLPVLALATLDMQWGRTDPDVVDDLIAGTIYSSNPVTAYDLYGITGSGNVYTGLGATVSLLNRIGMARTILDHAPGYTESVGVGSDNWTTARDANRLLEWIWSSSEFSVDWREYLLGRMTEVKPGLNYLMAAVPGGTVSHKNGFLETSVGTFVDNDIAIVRAPGARGEYAYAISFFSQGVETKYADIPLGQQIASETWSFFAGQYSGG